MTTDTSKRKSVVLDIAGALGSIPDGAIVGLGGTLTAGRPMALLRELLRRQPRNLTIVSPVATLDVDLAIAAGSVGRVVTSYVGAEGAAGVGPVFRAAAERGEVVVVDRDEAHCIIGLRAAGQGLPFLPWLGGVGTDLPRFAEGLVEFQDPVAGRTLLAVPAIEVDVALIHVETADMYGNVQFAGTGGTDFQLASAARRVVIEADRIVPTDWIRRSPGSTYFWRNSALARAPFGTHPYASAGIETDGAHLKEFIAAAKAAGRGDEGALANYLETYVYGPKDHDDYLETVGIRRIVGLLT